MRGGTSSSGALSFRRPGIEFQLGNSDGEDSNNGKADDEEAARLERAGHVYILNAVAAAAHLAAAVAIIALVGGWRGDGDDGRDITYGLVQSVVRWIPPDEQARDVVGGGIPTVRFKGMVLQPALRPVAVHLSTTVIVVAFFMLSMFFQSLWVILHELYIELLVDAGVNVIRYVEYSFSASIMLMLLALQVGIWEWAALVGVVACCWACMLFGLFAELWVHEGRKDIAVGAHVCGWVALAAPFTVIWGTVAGLPDAPREAVILIAVQTVCFLAFGATQVAQIAAFPGWNMGIEIAFIVQSLVSKFALAFGLYALVLVNV